MTWRVSIEKRAQRSLKRIPEPHRGRLYRKIHSLAQDPKPAGAQKVADKENTWRIRVGDYRFLYALDSRHRTVQVLDARHRRDIYRRNRLWIPNLDELAGAPSSA